MCIKKYWASTQGNKKKKKKVFRPDFAKVRVGARIKH